MSKLLEAAFCGVLLIILLLTMVIIGKMTYRILFEPSAYICDKKNIIVQLKEAK